MFNWAKGTPKSSTPIQSNLQKLWGWVSTQPRKYLLGIYTSCSSLAGLGHEAAPCYQESWPSCVRLQLCFSPTFRGNLHLFGALLNIRPLVFSLLFLPRPSAEPLFLSRPPIGVGVLLAPRRLSPRCRRALWQMWFTRSPLLVWGQSFLKVALISQSAPAGGRAALLSLPQHLHINDEAAVHATLTLGLHPQPGIVFKKAQWKGYLFQQNVTWCQQPSLFCRHSITVKCRLEMFFFISWVGFVKNPSAYVKKQVLLLDSETQIRCWLCVCVCVWLQDCSPVQWQQRRLWRQEWRARWRATPGEPIRWERCGAHSSQGWFDPGAFQRSDVLGSSLLAVPTTQDTSTKLL